MNSACRLAYFRKRSGLTQDEVAKQLGISRNSLVAYERGESDVPLTILLKLAGLYEFDIFDVYSVHGANEGVYVDTGIYEVAKTHIRHRVLSDMNENKNVNSGVVPTGYYETLYKFWLREFMTNPTMKELFPSEVEKWRQDESGLFD